jgi:L-ribulose-5-phosphate 4-epimerase
MAKFNREEVCKINKGIENANLTLFTWGTGSGRSEKGFFIKPSGVPYKKLTKEMLVEIDLTGKIIKGKLNPSVDTMIHAALYQAFPEIGGVVHTHSIYGCAFAQAGIPIPALGTTGADYFLGEISVTRQLTKKEVENNYEANTGKVIVETIKKNGRDPFSCPAILVPNHGPFAWGKTPEEALHNAIVVERIAQMAYLTLNLNSKSSMPKYLADTHFFRKHGANARYGQKIK